jgi:hypothetical protein
MDLNIGSVGGDEHGTACDFSRQPSLETGEENICSMLFIKDKMCHAYIRGRDYSGSSLCCHSLKNILDKQNE